MKRVLVMLALLGCSRQIEPLPPLNDAGPPSEVHLSVSPVVTVVLGETSSVGVDVAVANTPSGNLTVTTSPLPDGITCSSATVSRSGTTHVTLTLEATADAALAELPVDVLVTGEGKIIASAPTQLEVSSVMGSLDPTFGDAGVVTLPSGADNPTAIGVAQDGTIVVAGLGATKVFVDRFKPGFMPGTPSLFGTNVTTSTAAAIASDGRVAIDAQDTSNNETITEIDATNAIIASPQVPAATALAWDGADLFVATTYDVRRVGPSGDSLVAADMNVASLETTAPGVVLAAGANSSFETVIATFTVDAATLDPSPAIKVSNDNVSATNTVTTSNGTLVGLGGAPGASVVRLDSQGAIVATYSLDTRFARASQVVALPNGEPLLLGIAQLAPQNKTSVPAGYVVGFDAAFGALGHTYIIEASTLAAGAIDATGRYLYVTGTMTGTSGFHGWIARVRLTSTP